MSLERDWHALPARGIVMPESVSAALDDSLGNNVRLQSQADKSLPPVKDGDGLRLGSRKSFEARRKAFGAGEAASP